MLGQKRLKAEGASLLPLGFGENLIRVWGTKKLNRRQPERKINSRNNLKSRVKKTEGTAERHKKEKTVVMGDERMHLKKKQNRRGICSRNIRKGERTRKKTSL